MKIHSVFLVLTEHSDGWTHRYSDSDRGIFATFFFEGIRNWLKSLLQNIRILKHGDLLSVYKQNWIGNIVKWNLGRGEVLDCIFFSWNPLLWSDDKPLNPRSNVVWILNQRFLQQQTCWWMKLVPSDVKKSNLSTRPSVKHKRTAMLLGKDQASCGLCISFVSNVL
jgi:hypothetical protein